MANRRSNYGYGGYGGYGGYNRLISGMRNNTLPNIGGQFALGVQQGQQMHALQLLEKRQELAAQEKIVLDALSNEAWAPDTSELSPWAAEIITDNLIDMKNQYFDATQQGLGSKVSIGDKAEMIRMQKQIMDATSKMGGDLLDLDNHIQLYMEDHDNLSWSGGKKEEFLKYIHKDATKRVDQKTGTVYITPVGGGKEITMKEFKEMYPTTIPNDIFDGLEGAYEAHRQSYFKGTYGFDDLTTTDINEAGALGLLQNLQTDIKKQINLGISRDPDASREDIVRSIIEDMDKVHGFEFDALQNKDGTSTRYAELQDKWERLGYEGKWVDGSEEDLLELRKATIEENWEQEFKSLEDEFIDWESDKTFSWITGQDIPKNPIDPIELRKIKLAENKYALDFYKATKGDAPPQAAIEAGGLYNRLVDGVTLELQNYNLSEEDITNNSTKFQQYKDRIQGLLNTVSDKNLNEKNFKILTADDYRDQTLAGIDEELYTNDATWEASEYAGAEYDKWIADNNKANVMPAAKKSNREEYVKIKMQDNIQNYELFYSIDQTQGVGASSTTRTITQPFQGDVTNPDHLAKSIIGIYDPGMLGYLPGEGGLSGVTPSNDLVKFFKDNPEILKDLQSGKSISSDIFTKILKEVLGVNIPK